MAGRRHSERRPVMRAYRASRIQRDPRETVYRVNTQGLALRRCDASRRIWKAQEQTQKLTDRGIDVQSVCLRGLSRILSYRRGLIVTYVATEGPNSRE